MNEQIINVLGYIGSFFVVLAYIFIQTKKIETTSKIYNFLNLFGAIFIGINSWHFGAVPSFLIQIVWGIVALFSLFKLSK